MIYTPGSRGRPFAFSLKFSKKRSASLFFLVYFFFFYVFLITGLILRKILCRITALPIIAHTVGKEKSGI
jgi:hypothetical protein